MTNLEQRDWSCLPQDVLGLIKSSFTLMDDVNKFGVVCKEWGKVEVYPKDHIGFGSEWLIRKQAEESSLELCHPLANMCNSYCIAIPDHLCHTFIQYSKDGWLLMSQESDMFFFNPFSKSTIRLPKLPPHGDDHPYYYFTCASNPMSEDRFVFVLAQDYNESTIIYTISKGKSNWIQTNCLFDECVHLCYANPVYHKRKFYCLCVDGELCVFDPNTKILEVLKPKITGLHNTVREGYLLDVDGDLISVFIDISRHLSIFKLDECNQTWKDVNDLGEYMFFLNSKTSFAKKAKRDFMRNKIYCPIEYDGYGVFYCLDDNSYQTFGNKLLFKTLGPTSITTLFQCCWIELTQCHCSSEVVEWIESGGHKDKSE